MSMIGMGGRGFIFVSSDGAIVAGTIPSDVGAVRDMVRMLAQSSPPRADRATGIAISGGEVTLDGVEILISFRSPDPSTTLPRDMQGLFQYGIFIIRLMSINADGGLSPGLMVIPVKREDTIRGPLMSANMTTTVGMIEISLSDYLQGVEEGATW